MNARKINVSSREKAEALYHALLHALDALGDYPMFRADVIEECGKAFERFLEKHCIPKMEHEKSEDDDELG